MTSGRGLSAFRAGLIGSAALVAAGVAGITHAEGRNPLKIADAQYEPAMFTDIDGWAEDDHDAAFVSFRNSCKALLRMLVADEEPSYEEIGAALKMPIGAIGPTRMRCLDKLRSTADLRELEI